MPKLKLGALAALLICVPQCVHAQTSADTPDDPYTPAIITGHPFSAIRYTRAVHVQPDGKRAITAEGHHVLMARDKDGRIYMAGAGMSDKHCDLPNLGKLPLCDYWFPFIADLKAGTWLHWGEGEFADKTQEVLLDMLPSQAVDAIRLTSALPKPPEALAEPGVTVQDLGRRNFQGVQARGLRTTTIHAGPDGQPAATIHEIWTSTQLRLVLRVIDGNPQGEETVTGLSHLSRTPDPALFQPPQDRTLRHWVEDPHNVFKPDVSNLTDWLGK